MGGTAPGHRAKFTIVLTCGHTVILEFPAPEVGDEQFCLKCNAYKHVKVAPPTFRSICLKGACRHKSRAQAEENAAIVLAKRHLNNYPRHTVGIFNGRNKVREVTNVGEELFSTPDELLSISREVQSLLRSGDLTDEFPY